MLLVLDLATNASGNQGQVALVGLFLVAIGGSCLWLSFESPLGLPVRLAKGSTISTPLKSLLKDLRITAQTAMACTLAHLWIRRTAKPGMQTIMSKKNYPSA